jgi:prepilin peptidase CpaA
VIAALILGLENRGPAPARDLGPEARAGDAAADDENVKINHFPRRLRIGKPRRLGVVVMFNAPFTGTLLAALAALLIVAAVIDARTFTISNRLNLTVALLAPLYWLSVALTPWPGVAIQLAAGATVFAVLAAAFYAGMMGGGDVKLAAALALWFPPGVTLQFLVLMSLAGGVLTLALLAWHRARRREGRPEIPYGVAIAFGGLAILAQRFLNQFA